MKKGRPAKPTRVKEITGNPGKRELNRNEPQFTGGVIEPPEHLDALAVAEWRRVFPELARNGLVTTADRAILALYCHSWARWVKACKALQKIDDLDPTFYGCVQKGTKGGICANPLERVVRDTAEACAKYAAHFGMSPSSRTSIQVAPERDENPFAQFENHNTAGETTH